MKSLSRMDFIKEQDSEFEELKSNPAQYESNY